MRVHPVSCRIDRVRHIADTQTTSYMEVILIFFVIFAACLIPQVRMHLVSKEEQEESTKVVAVASNSCGSGD